jgi:hypothetical protein
MAAMTLSEANRTLNGGTANNGAGIFINTIAPPVPTLKILSANNASAVVINDINGSPVRGESGNSAVDLKNIYNNGLWFAIEGDTTLGSYQLGGLEYSLDDGTSWKKIVGSNVPFQQTIYGKYTIRTRQVDKAGNNSPITEPVSLNWDPGDLVTRIDSSTPNGTYTYNAAALPIRADQINITVYFRKKLDFTGTPSITLNAVRGTGAVTAETPPTINSDQLSFTYSIEDNDNTPTGFKLDVTGLSITAKDTDGVTVNSSIKLPATAGSLLRERKELYVQTGPLTVSAPSYAMTSTANDEWAGTITFTFNRNITKKGGNVTITQQSAGYRLPAVLTEDQSNRYKTLTNFTTFYSKGTNGFVNDAPDTSTKYVLNYDESTDVTIPVTGGTIKQVLARAFLEAETISLPVTSQDITVSGNTLTIELKGSNALQVLGAGYDVNFDADFVQDALSYSWPAASITYTDFATTGINRPFVRIDKKVNEDRIRGAAGDWTMPHLLADFSRLYETTARMDCRTPNSIVRFAAAGATHTANGPTTNSGRTGGGVNANWRNGAPLNNNPANNDPADKFDYLDLPTQTLNTNGGAGTLGGTLAGALRTGYVDTTTQIAVGPGNETDGYIWRVSVRSRNGTGGATNSGLFEEVAFRTVLTYQLFGVQGHNTQIQPGASKSEGQKLNAGDQLWIRGGDAIGSSSIPGFPLTWRDDYNDLAGKRAGARLLRRESSVNYVANTSNFNTNSIWRWVTWEINVRTWHDVVLVRGLNPSTAYSALGDAQDKDDAWQYGPYRWAYQRGGWAALKDDYTLYPGKHRWLRISDASYGEGSHVDFSLEWNGRITTTVVDYQQPDP